MPKLPCLFQNALKLILHKLSASNQAICISSSSPSFLFYNLSTIHGVWFKFFNLDAYPIQILLILITAMIQKKPISKNIELKSIKLWITWLLSKGMECGQCLVFSMDFCKIWVLWIVKTIAFLLHRVYRSTTL